MKLSGLYSSLFVIRFSLIFYLKNFVVVGGGKQKRTGGIKQDPTFFMMEEGQKEPL